MNEDFLPDNYKMMAQSQTADEYLNNLYSHASFARDHIQWYIDYIREILKKMPFPCSDTLDEKMKKRARKLQKKRDKQLESLNLSEIAIKEDVNKLLNAMAGSVNHTWNDSNLGKIVGFQSDTIKCSDDLIPLPIQSLYYVSSLTYGYLVNHAISAIILKYKVISLTEKDPQKKEEMLYNVLIKMQKEIRDIQKRMKDDKEELTKLIKNRNKIDEEKTGILSIEQCIIYVGKIKKHYIELRRKDCMSIGVPPESVKELKERTIRRYVELWDQYQRGNIKKGRKPPREDYSRNMTMDDYAKLINAAELDAYNKWRARNRIAERSKVYVNH